MSSGADRRLFGLSLPSLEQLAREHGEPAYRGRQLFDALYRQRVPELDGMTSLPQRLRAALKESGWTAGLPEVRSRFESVDGTIRYLTGFPDGEMVETVWMPEGDGGESGDGSEAAEESDGSRGFDRATICVSSQAGCAVNCRFCFTAKLGMRRNLTAGEIAGQVVAVLNDRGAVPGRDRINLVFMGMGEPFLNYEAFMEAVRLLVEGVGLPESRMTVSTSGIVPRIFDFGREPIRPKLAISLNGSNDAVREQVMPINRKWDIGALLEAVRALPLRPRERVTFEYVLLGGVNDREGNAREVARLLRGLRAKVNLIAWNPGPGIEYRMPAERDVERFREILVESGIPAYVRRPRGRDIYAACGQLKRTETDQRQAV